MITTYVINKISLSCKKEFYCNDCKKKQNLLIFFIFQGIRQTGTGVGPDKTPFDGSPYPVDAGGDGREVGTLIFLFDEVTQAGEGKSWRSCDKSLIFRPGKDEAGYENEHKHQTELTD